MSFKGRTKFVLAGYHPLLQLVRDQLINTGYALVPWTERPDFCLFGGALPEGANVATEVVSLAQQAQGIYGAGIPVVLLSSPLSSGRLPQSAGVLYQAVAEHLFVQNTLTMVLRVFNVYGPAIPEGVVPKFVHLARRGKALPVYDSGYQTCTFLYQEDFFACIDVCVRSFVATEQGGFYDVGHPEGYSIKRLADSIWQLTHGKDVATVVETVRGMPYETHISPKPFHGWKPKVSLRQGLWLLVGSAVNRAV